MPVTYLLINFTLAEDKICYILSIILLPYFNIVDVIDSKSLYKKSKTMTIAMLSQMS